MIILKDQLRKYDIGYDIECQHDLWVGVDEDGKKHVAMANDDDECYVQFFISKEEIEQFISELRECSIRAFGQ